MSANKKGNKKPMEVLWACMCVVCLVVAIVRTVKFGIDQGIPMYCFSGISLLMFFWRRSLRRQEEKDDEKMQ